jgi:outer membrane protein insertion porin family
MTAVPQEVRRRRTLPSALRAAAAALGVAVAIASGGLTVLRPACAEEPRPRPPLTQTQPPVLSRAGPEAKAADYDAEELLEQPLVDVIVEGNTTIYDRAILHYVKSVPGRKVSQQQIKEDLAALINTNWFFRVTPTFRSTPEGPVLVFQVTEKPIIRSVEFVGNKKIKTPQLVAITGLTAGHGYDVAANREAAARLKRHYREKGYYFAEVTLAKGDHPDERDVVFEIDEGKKVKVWSIGFDGNDFISGPVLKTKLATKTVILWLVGGDYDPETIKNDATILTQYYNSLGFFDARVEPVETFSDDKSKVRVAFRIEEGTRFRVRNVELAGNEVISEEKLREKSKLKAGDAFNERLLREDMTFMKDQYDEQGRLFAQVQPVPRFLEESGWVDLVYHIDEDKPYYIGEVNVSVRGDHPHTKETAIRNQVNPYIKPGRLAKMSDIKRAQIALNGNQLWDRADPPSVNVNPVEGRDYMPGALIARGQAESGTGFQPVRPRSEAPERGAGRVGNPSYLDDLERVGRTRLDVLGPTTTEDGTATYNVDPDVIFRGQSPGDFVFRGQSIDAYGNPLPQDYLQGVSPQGDPFGDALRNPATPGFVDVNIDVTEARTGRLMFGVGVNSDAGVVGSIVLQEDNFDILRPPTSWSDVVNGYAFRGNAQSFRLELVPGTQVSRYLVNWQDPFFLNTDFSFGLSGFYYNRYYDDWTEDRAGGRISLGRLINRYWSAGAALRLENVQIRDVPAVAPALLNEVKGDNFLSTVRGTVTYDTRDSAFLPTQGHFVELAYEQGFGEFTYPRADVSGGQYFTVWRRPDGLGKHILQFRGQVGWTGDETPIFERFYAGGYSSFRGFAFRGVSPRDTGVSIGGQWLVLGTAEYMFPITADDNIRGVVFCDSGTVEEDVSLDQFRVTAGFGVRLTIPAMGPAPIALDFAWPILAEPFDEERVFSFYVGFTR